MNKAPNPKPREIDMSKDFGPMRVFAEHLTAALDVAENAAAGEARVADAGRRLRDIEARITQAHEAHGRLLSDHQGAIDKAKGELEATLKAHERAIADHKTKTDGITEAGRVQLEETRSLRDKFNTEIGKLRTQRDELSAQVEHFRAKIADLAATI